MVSAGFRRETKQNNMKKFFYIKNGLVLGSVVHEHTPSGGGWRWHPYNTAHRPSRRPWATAVGALQKARVRGGELIEVESFAEAVKLAESRFVDQKAKAAAAAPATATKIMGVEHDANGATITIRPKGADAKGEFGIQLMLNKDSVEFLVHGKRVEFAHVVGAVGYAVMMF